MGAFSNEDLFASATTSFSKAGKSFCQSSKAFSAWLSPSLFCALRFDMREFQQLRRALFLRMAFALRTSDSALRVDMTPIHA